MPYWQYIDTQLSAAIPNDFALCLPGSGTVDLLFPDADTRSSFCANRALGRRTVAALELPLAQYVATERILSPGGRGNTCEWRE